VRLRVNLKWNKPHRSRIVRSPSNCIHKSRNYGSIISAMAIFAYEFTAHDTDTLSIFKILVEDVVVLTTMTVIGCARKAPRCACHKSRDDKKGFVKWRHKVRDIITTKEEYVLFARVEFRELICAIMLLNVNLNWIIIQIIMELISGYISFHLHENVGFAGISENLIWSEDNFVGLWK